MLYISQHSGEEIDSAVFKTENLQLQIDSINSTIAQLNNSILNFNNSLSQLNNSFTTSINKINLDIDSLSNKIIPINLGGTGATSVDEAINNLGGSYASATWDITNNITGTISTTLTVTTHGRPVFVGVQYTMQGVGGNGYWGTMSIFRDGVHLHSGTVVCTTASNNVPGIILYLDTVPAGTYTYTFSYGVGSGTIQLNETNVPSGNQSELPFVFAFEI